jgi:hypothetical protein
MNRDFKDTVLGWIKEELEPPMTVTTLAEDPMGDTTKPFTLNELADPLYDPVEEDIIELTEADMIPEMVHFNCERCLYHAVVKQELIEEEYRMFCPRCDNTLFDEELKK